MEKVVRNGNVAVLYSPGFGAGWGSWNDDYPAMVFDPIIVAMVETQDFTDFENYCEKTYPDAYCSRANLTVGWVPVGEKFRIDEYQGSERIVLEKNEKRLEA